MSALGLVLVLALLAGCGGGGEGGGGEKGNGGGDGGGDKTTTEGEKKGKAKPPTGSVIRDFQAQLAGNRVRLSYTLTKPVELSLRVERGSGESAERVGKVDFGNRPKGAGTLMWNLALDGKRVPAGRYSLQLRGSGAGKSRPVTITVPGA